MSNRRFRLFIAALWSPEGKGLTSWFFFVMFVVILLLSHLISWDRCGTWLYRFLILAVFLTFSRLNNDKDIICGHVRKFVTLSIIFCAMHLIDFALNCFNTL